MRKLRPHYLLATTGFQKSILRGPPRKPKQSGHALWVGNLPPGANVVDLKDHFSREATNDILSVFLISKSNCAFVNYKTEGSCSAAMTRFHDSRFQGVRLVCRLRRISVNPATGVPTGPAASLGSSPAMVEPALEVDSAIQESETSPEFQDTTHSTSLAKDKFFIVKSLTVEDLELSVRNGVWATQSHNEEALNKAYEVREKTTCHASQLIGHLVCGKRLLDLLCQ
jgi:YT521-B-like domain/RNA recognition motif. (a.k.a. RRM, RBD, or RNP domain)